MGNLAQCIARDDETYEEKGRSPSRPGQASPSSSCRSRKEFQRQLTDLPHDWMNSLLEHLWPSIAQYLTNTLKDTVEPAIKSAVPALLRGVRFEQIDFGRYPIQFRNHCIKEYTRCFQEAEIENLELQMEMVWESDANILLNLSGAKVGVSSISLRGPMVISFQRLIPRPPFFFGITMYFPNPPALDMDWRGVAASLDSFTVIPSKAREVALRQICNRLVLPNRMGIVAAGNADGADIFWLKRSYYSGILEIDIDRAENLPVGDPSWVPGLQGTSDPYVVVTLGAQEMRTAYKTKTLNPEWDRETGRFLVDHEDIQVVTFSVFDKDFHTEDDFLGAATIGVSELLQQMDRDDGVWLDLADPENKCGSLGSRLQITPRWRPLERSGAEMIPEGCEDVSCLVYICLYRGEGLPQIGPEGLYWLQVTVEDTVQESYRCYPAMPGCATRTERDLRMRKYAEKISRLQKEGCSAEAIAEVLELGLPTVEDYLDELTERGEDTFNYEFEAFATVEWEQPFTFFIKDPHEAVVDFKLMTDGDLQRSRAFTAAPGKQKANAGYKEQQVGIDFPYAVKDLLGQEKLRTKGYLDLDIPGCPQARLSVKMGLMVLGQEAVGPYVSCRGD